MEEMMCSLPLGGNDQEEAGTCIGRRSTSTAGHVAVFCVFPAMCGAEVGETEVGDPL